MQLHYTQSGQGPDVVLIHGLFGSLDNLNVIKNALAESFRVTNIDVRNHGLSPHSDEMSYPAMADDVYNLCQRLGITRPHLVGHSMGGKIAMQYALSHPDAIAKLVVLDIAPVGYHSRHDTIFSALEKVEKSTPQTRKDAENLMTDDIKEAGVRQFLLKSLAKGEDGLLHWRFNLTSLKANYGNILSGLNASNSCSCDTLFLKGSESDYIEADHRNAILSLFPNAKAKIISGTGHWLHAEKPAAVTKSIADFLTQ